MCVREIYFNRDRLLVTRVVLAFILFLSASFLLKGKGLDEYVVMIFGSTTFVFGVLLAFYISSFNGRFETVISELQMQNGAILNVYYTSLVFGKKISDEVRNKIDEHLIDQLDFFLYDYSESSRSFMRLFEHVVALEATSDKEKSAYGNMISNLGNALTIRKNVESKVRSQMSGFEWLSLIILLTVVLLCLFFLNTNMFFASVVISLLATSTVMLLFILHDIETFRWKEQTSIWEPIGRVFEELGLHPYYPKEAIAHGRIVPRKGTIRVSSYPHHYPDMRDKVVEVVNLRK